MHGHAHVHQRGKPTKHTHMNAEQEFRSLTDVCINHICGPRRCLPKWARVTVPTTDHLPKELLWSVSKERDAAHQELIQDYAHGPPVHWLPIALAQDHLRRNVLRGPAYLGEEKPGWLSFLRQLIGMTAGGVKKKSLNEDSANWLMSRINRRPRVPELELLRGW